MANTVHMDATHFALANIYSGRATYANAAAASKYR